LQLINRLKLSAEKLQAVCKGIRSLARSQDPVNQRQELTELLPDLLLEKVSCPIGVLLVIFEARPDCMPQVAALAIRSGNALLLKGGKEAQHSNACMHRLVSEAIVEASEQRLGSELVGLVHSREDVSQLLQLDKFVDLVIPRGSNALVAHIQANTRIPVLGHADGVCHIFVDAAADLDKAVRIVLDAKTDYPSACNAVETLLLHAALVISGQADALLRALRAKGVLLRAGPRALQLGLAEQALQSFHTEYGDLQLSVEVVDDMRAAAAHINAHSSAHTECIVTENAAVAEDFLRLVDSACVFHNASTRFADGYRFGLGAEVGISTSRLHARGPVGVKGLLTTKWLLRSSNGGHVVNAGGSALEYTHRKLSLVP
jgi:delta-1-pyrroline-5-carboxylate synthetase